MVEKLLKRYERDLALKGFSFKTQKTYYQSLIKFLQHVSSDPHDITKENIKDYLYYLIHDRKLSESTLRQARCAITYFFTQTLSMPIEVETIPCHKKPQKLPSVFSLDEVFRIINAADNMKHRMMLMLAYSSGLRVGELVRIKIADIRRNIMRLAVRQGKGQKDRYAILSSVRAVQHAYTSAKQKARIARPGGIHSLRHSFATHMLETGGGIFQLQKFLGHKHLKTTLVYAHISEEHVIARSPLDVYAEKFHNESSHH
jgi:integrase/recombinase XerD